MLKSCPVKIRKKWLDSVVLLKSNWEKILSQVQEQWYWLCGWCWWSLLLTQDLNITNAGLKGYRQIQLEMCKFAESTIEKQPWSYFRILSPPVTHLFKTECSHPQAGCSLQVSLLGWDPPGSCPAASGDQLAQLTQAPGAFCTLLQAHVYQNLSQPSPLSHLWNALIMQTSRQLLLQFSLGVLIFGQIITAWERGLVCVEDTLPDPTIFCHHHRGKIDMAE